MTSSPDALKTFKNFAMSQSPPSYSPMRRQRETQEAPFSESSPESAADEANKKEADSPGGVPPAGETGMDEEGSEEEEPQTEVAGVPQEQTAMDAEDDEASEDEGVAANSPSAFGSVVPGVSVTQQNSPGSSEGDEEDQVMQDAAPAALPASDVGPQPQSPGSSEEDEDQVMQDGANALPATDAPAFAPQTGDAEVDEGSESEEQQQEQQQQPVVTQQDQPDDSEEEDEDQPASAEKMEVSEALVPVAPADQQNEDQALVPVEAAETTDRPCVIAGPRSPNREAGWGALPEEAKGAWTVHGDYCSLEVNGQTLKLPRAVYDRLFVYQRQGVAWMWNLYMKSTGGILADEMGLGKTIQVAAFLACVKFSGQGSRFLLVVPPTLLEQWKRELKEWAGATGLAVHVMHGTQQERRAALRGMLARQGVMLTTYDLVRNCIEHLRDTSVAKASALLPKKRKKTTKRGCRDDDSPSEAEEELPAADADDANRPWDVVIVDEGHQIKNPSCLVGRALRKLESRTRFLLTGTPLQNKLGDLWALMDFCQPGLLGNHATFERNFSEQIAKGSKRNATRFAVELKDHLARELRRLTAPHFLRRLKDEVLTDAAASERGDAPAPEELPPKTDVVLWLNLTNAQVELYNLFLSSETVRRATSGRNGMEALRAIAMLKKLTNHPLLCLPKEEFTDWRMRTCPSAAGKAPGAASSSAAPPVAAAPAAAAPAPAPDGELPDLDDDGATQPSAESHDFLARLRALLPGSAEGSSLLSCKLRIMSVLLPQLQKRGHRCLIFSHSTRMLDLIQACVLRVLGLKFLRIDGTIEAKDRDLKIGKFQAPDSRYFCMCLSSQVGGVGLTITGADRVILCDPAWNPAMDAQAIDRVHRIGQKKEVVVYRLIGSGAIEDKMFRLQVFKRSLAKTAMEQESQIRFFSNKDLKQLFEPPNQGTSTQSLMAEQLGTEALEHEDLLSVVAGDIGGTDDPEAMAFWQSSDVLGFSDYSRLFMYLEKIQKAEEETEHLALQMTEKLQSEEYKKDQVVEGKWRAKDNTNKENVSTQVQQEVRVPLADASSASG